MISLPMLWLNKNLRGPRHSVYLWTDMLSSISDFDRTYLLYTYQMHESETGNCTSAGATPPTYTRACWQTGDWAGSISST